MWYSRTLSAIAALALVDLTRSDCPTPEWGQCGGKDWSGSTCCKAYDECHVVNAYYSQCQPHDLCLNPEYGQCGGFDHHQPPRPWNSTFNHSTCCPPSFDCQEKNRYYSQCVYDNKTSTCAGAYKQCGGRGWSGPTCCIPGFKCVSDGSGYYSGCKPEPFCQNARFGQCGGIDAEGHPWTKEYDHDTCCPEAFTCVVVNKYYSQCIWHNATGTTRL